MNSVTTPASTPSTQAMLPFAGSSFWALPQAEQDRMLRDLEVYRRELRRLLAEHEAGRFCVVKDGVVASVWDTAGNAQQAADMLFGGAPVSVYEIKPQDMKRSS